MAANPLTKRQARQVQELDEIYSIIGLEYRGLEDLSDEERRARFRIVKDQTIRSEVLMKYVKEK